ncbi:hypothetical protein NCCP2145_14020 [Pseudarthrobacter sp. NCCP-2145]|nr:hypothetical protein NCCP2145_14020 [Pseudarthrobacter sp. NCCP-2145]
MKRDSLDDIVTAAEVLADKTEQMAAAADRMKVAVNSIVGNAKTIYGVVTPLLGFFKSK